MIWARVLAYVTGTVNQELLLRNEYLAAENRILRAKIKGRLLLSDGEKATLAEIAHRLGRKALDDLSAAARPETLLRWYRKLIANKYDVVEKTQIWGRPRIDQETERLVIRTSGWQGKGVYASGFKDRPKRSTVFAVTIMQKVSLPNQKTRVFHRHIARHLFHPLLIRMRVIPATYTFRLSKCMKNST